MVRTPWDPKQTPYPATRRDEAYVETFKSATRGEVKVPDPYHWLSTPPSQSEETRAFVEKQGAFTDAYLSQYGDRDRFKAALKQTWNYPRFSCPALKEDGNYYFSYNSGLDPQPALYRFKKEDADKARHENPGGELFFDPGLLSKDGSVSRSSSAFSPTGEHFAYALSRSGSDWVTIRVRPTSAPHRRDQEVGSDEGRLGEELRYVKFSGIGWTKDGKGFFYQRFPARAEHGESEEDKAGTETDRVLNAAIYYHRVGTSQEDDVFIYKNEQEPEWLYSIDPTEDGRFLVFTASRDTARSNLLWIADLQETEIGPNLKWKRVINEWGSYWGDIANDGTLFYFYTSADDALNYKIVTYDLSKPDEGFKELIAHDDKALLSSVHVSDKNKLWLLYSVDVKDELYLHDLQSGKRIKRVGADLVGTIEQISGRREDPEMFFSMSGFTTPGTIYHFDHRKEDGQEVSVYRTIDVPGINPDDFISEQVFYKSKDGTRVPMFVTRPKDVPVDGSAAALLYGYGGFSISITPFFSPSMMSFIKNYGAVLAVANIRGGGEYGESWHLAGTKERKQNVFDDFQAAAQWLQTNKYTGKQRVAIAGGSNGGLLVAACINQAPELFGAGIADVGVMDMLRFHRYSGGALWKSDYWDPDDPEGFDCLQKLSPLENVDGSKTYAPLMLLTADHDDRVVPLHSFKLAAELQHKLPNNPNPLLLRVDTKSGHGAGKSTEKKIDEAVDKYGFVAQSMGLEWRE